VGVAVSAARDEILARVRRALDDVPRDERADDVAVSRAYAEREPGDSIERFVERVSDYGATVRLTRDVAGAVAEACRVHGVTRLAVPADVPGAWVPPDVDAVEDAPLDVGELDRIGAALTGCALAIAETGTIVLDAGPRQGRRVLTLVPDLHVCVLEAAQVVDGVPAALRLLADRMRTTRRPLTFVSGPSATSDIELSRVEGVHGPRRLEVVIAES